MHRNDIGTFRCFNRPQLEATETPPVTVLFSKYTNILSTLYGKNRYPGRSEKELQNFDQLIHLFYTETL